MREEIIEAVNRMDEEDRIDLADEYYIEGDSVKAVLDAAIADEDIAEAVLQS